MCSLHILSTHSNFFPQSKDMYLGDVCPFEQQWYLVLLACSWLILHMCKEERGVEVNEIPVKHFYRKMDFVNPDN